MIYINVMQIRVLEDDLMKRVVFLDYDGVVNRNMWTKVNGEWVCRFGYPEDGQVNDEQAVQWISEFCEKYGYDIVVTSTWRKYPEWESCLRNAGLRDNIKILGCTALPTKNRAEEISDYLAEHNEIKEYLIFDDKRELAKACPEHLVLCDPIRGFGEHEYEKAVEMHNKFK